VLRWHPVWIEPDPQHLEGNSGVVPEWGPTDTVPDGALPPFGAACLANWRLPVAEPTDTQLLQRMVWFEQNGYVMYWVQRPDGEQGQPQWMDVLRPIM
jgi:hypothetical protein